MRRTPPRRSPRLQEATFLNMSKTSSEPKTRTEVDKSDTTTAPSISEGIALNASAHVTNVFEDSISCASEVNAPRVSSGAAFESQTMPPSFITFSNEAIPNFTSADVVANIPKPTSCLDTLSNIPFESIEHNRDVILLSMQKRIDNLQSQLKLTQERLNERDSQNQVLQIALQSTSTTPQTSCEALSFKPSTISVSTVESRANLYQETASCSSVKIQGATSLSSIYRSLPSVGMYKGAPASEFGTTNHMPPISSSVNYDSNLHQNDCANSNHLPQLMFPRKVQDLPPFSGQPEEWPIFYNAFIQTTNAYRYTNLENNHRLQKSLTGVARDTVKFLLIHPDNVEAVIDQLRFRFGRPELLIRSQLNEVREVQVINENSVTKIIQFATKVKNLAVFLQSVNANQHLANPTLLEELVSKLPMSKKLEWAKCAVQIQPYPTILHFSHWLSDLANLICIVQDIETKEPKRRVTVLHTANNHSTYNQKCVLCENQHKVSECPDFVDKTASERWCVVKRHRLCFTCLRMGHSMYNCRSKKQCSVKNCKRQHHSLLHEDVETTGSVSEHLKQSNSDVANGNTSFVAHCFDSLKNTKREAITNDLLFRVLPVTLYGPNKTINVYALFDEGSSITMLDGGLINELGLRGQDCQLNMQWIGGRQAQEPTTLVNLYISAAGQNKKHFLKNVYGVSKLDLPTQSLAEKDFREITNVDIQTYSNVVPKLLIGLDNCHLGLPKEIVQLKNSGPYATNTELGWVVFGQAGNVSNTTATAQTCLLNQGTSNESLHMLVAEFFETDSFGIRPSPPIDSKGDIRARQILKSTTKKVNQKYQAGLLWKCDDVTLPESYSMALKRLVGIERKIKRNENFGFAYSSIIKDYVAKKYARKLDPEEAAVHKPKTWYLPHFGVVNPNKPTKMRLVFDAAAEVKGTSLNSFLMKGPQQYRALPSVLFHFREGPVAVCGDIKEMFHQILIQPEDRCAQRFLWRDGDDTRRPDVYEMLVMTFGAACSPCIAEYVKTINAREHRSNDSRAIKSILDFHYVDDFVDSFHSIEQAINISRQVRDIHKDAGFELRNFSSNSKKVLDAIEGENVPLVVDSKSSLYTEKILGMYWQPVSDEFCYQLKFHRVEKEIIAGERIPTKRELLSVVMSMFDPLGFLNHFTINAKLLMREVWRYNTRWDEPLPNEVVTAWTNWLMLLPSVVDFKIPRFYFRDELPKKVQLHVFVDSSEDAFAAVAYWRAENHKGEVDTSLVCSKTKCAPLRSLTIPRLELQAAVLGARLMKTLAEEHSFQICRTVLWSDSTTVLSWIASEHRRYKPFVAHRIAEIVNTTDPSNWRWVPTRENPADDATRTTNIINFESSSRWLTGPHFLLKGEEYWPKNSPPSAREDVEEELRPKFALVIVSNQFIKFNRFSSISRLIRTTAWVLHFINCCRMDKGKRSIDLFLAELEAGEKLLCCQAQKESFAKELKQIACKQPLEKGSPLHKLSPYVDNDGLLRVFGRLDAASCLTYAAKRPIILPSYHAFTILVVKDHHHKMKHQNIEATICEIRRKYWIPRLRQTLRKVISNCLVCKIARTNPVPPLMGSLPEDRLTPFVRPFSYTGLDYFGPISVTVGRRTEKRWVALFTCLAVRAIHLEVVHDLSTDACILAIRNFINRRGVPVRIRSDNGTNFIGTANESKRFPEVFESEQLKGELKAKGIEWIFNCPANPAEGGVWERMVQCVKKVLHHTLKEVAPREFTLQSLIIEAENVVNSRPLTHIPITPDQEEPLTPNHFLLGSANTAQTPAKEEPLEDLWRLTKQWRISRQLRDRFWKKWVTEYLPTLTRRTKWCQRTKSIAIGDLVFLCDANVPRNQWCRGRIENVYPGTDGHIRRVDVRTSKGLIQRPVSKLAVLDVMVSESESIHGGGDVAERRV